MEPAGRDRTGTAEPLAPASIGPYRLLEVLGEGGMGTVYLAEQRQPLLRRVALKVVKLGMDSRVVLARFEVERQALAMMEHDNIAKVLDAGIAADGRPFFAMEYVQGVPITDFCERARLGLRERLELFCKVCQGIQHAHNKGVIHRDLKPANILVTTVEGRPVPKIIDFGLARAMERRIVEASLFTECGQILGTPEYMSPEQAGLGGRDIDSRTDVYSLGVLLYELLVGERPFPEGERDLLEIQRLVREVDPPRPSSRIAVLVTGAAAGRDRKGAPGRQAWLRTVRGDLDWIVMRALEKDPDRRYQTALALADELGRNLRSEPVEARPPTLAYRLSRFVHKHRVPVAAAALVMLAIVAGAIVSLWLLVETQDARRRAELAVHESSLQLARTQMAAIDQAAFWTAQAVAVARAPTMQDVQAYRVDGRPVLPGQAGPLRDPWGNEYRIEPSGAAGDWLVCSCGPDARPGSDDDIEVHDRMFTLNTQQRLVDLFEQRAARLLDLAQEWLVMGRTQMDAAQLDHEAAVDPWGRAVALEAQSEQLIVRSGGPDGVLGSADDLASVRDLMPPTVLPQDVRAHIGRSRRVYSVVHLERARAEAVVASLGALLAGSAGLMQGLTMGSIGDAALGVLGPPEKVAFVIENVRQFDGGGSVR